MPNLSLHYAGKVPAQERGQAELTDTSGGKKNSELFKFLEPIRFNRSVPKLC